MTILLAQHFKVDARDIYNHYSCGEEPTEIELDPCFESYFLLVTTFENESKVYVHRFKKFNQSM